MFKCKNCEEIKELSEFYLDKRSKNNIPRQPCKVCSKIEGKLRREKYKQELKDIPLTKVCTICNKEKPRSEFHARIDSPNGLRNSCISCYNAESRVYYRENSEHVIERTSNYRESNKLLYNWLKRERYRSNPELYKEKDRLYREANKDRLLQWSREYYSRPEVKERMKISRLKYLSNPINKQKQLEAGKRWRDKNKHKVCQYSANRRARLKQATPKWVDMEIVQSFYAEAQYFGESVDHIIPLTHPLVCGLHCEDNLQLLPLIDNIAKNNKFEVCEHELPTIKEEL
uniref:HNH endonuclease n=1 Tax=Vibrio phage P018-4 TaxID=3229728 RepID=A0AB39AJL1_9CAUD